jgi:hypothetical protein
MKCKVCNSNLTPGFKEYVCKDCEAIKAKFGVDLQSYILRVAKTMALKMVQIHESYEHPFED